MAPFHTTADDELQNEQARLDQLLRGGMLQDQILHGQQISTGTLHEQEKRDQQEFNALLAARSGDRQPSGQLADSMKNVKPSPGQDEIWKIIFANPALWILPVFLLSLVILVIVFGLLSMF